MTPNDQPQRVKPGMFTSPAFWLGAAAAACAWYWLGVGALYLWGVVRALP